jgi:hypothetical protein
LLLLFVWLLWLIGLLLLSARPEQLLSSLSPRP